MTNNDAAFEAWWRWLLPAEGGWSDKKSDRGGKTNMGVTLATYLQYAKEFGLPKNVAGLIALTPDQQKLFARKFWELGRCDKMPAKVAVLHADFGWGSGTVTAAIHLQRVCGVVDDGIIGPITLAKVNSIMPSVLLDALYKDRAQFLTAISHGDQIVNRAGWHNRNNSCYELAKTL